MPAEQTREEGLSDYTGHLRMQSDGDPGIAVEVDIDAGRMRVASGDVEIADWSLDEIRVNALPDGFHIRAEGEEVIIDVSNDGHFAVDLGLQTAHPALRQKMSAILRERSSGSPSQ